MVQWQLHPTGTVMKKLLPLLFLLFTTLYANNVRETPRPTDVLPPLVKDGELFENRDDYYISSRNSVSSVAISPDDTKIVSCSEEDGNSIKIWNIVTGRALSLEGHKGFVGSVAISPDGTKIVSGSWDKSIKIWDMATGKELKSLEATKDAVFSVAISPDGTKIVSGSSDNMIKIWDMATGKELKSLEGHEGSVNSVVISSDGTKIVSASWNGSIKIWDSAIGKEIKSLEGHKDIVSSVVISKDDRIIVSGSNDGSVKEWNMSEKKWKKEFVAGRGRTWVTFIRDAKRKYFLRGDDGTLLMKRKGNVSTLFPPKDRTKEDTLVFDKVEPIELVNATEAKVTIKLLSQSSKSYFIKAHGQSDYAFVKENGLSKLEQGKKGVLRIPIGTLLPRMNPKPINDELNLTVTTANGSEFNLSVPVSIRYANIVVEKAEVSEDGENLNVVLQNKGNEKLVKSEVRLLAPFEADLQNLTNLEANGTRTLSFVIGDKNVTKPLNIKVFIADERNPELMPLYEWHREGISISLNKLAWYIYTLWVLTGLVVLGLIFYFRRYRNTLVLQLQNNPKSLLTLSPTLLAEAKNKLEKIGELESVLKSVGIEEKQLDEAIGFDEHKKKEALFSKRIPKSYLLHEGEQHKLACQKTELSVDDFLLYFTSQNANEIEEQFKEDGNRVFVVGSEEEREAIAKLARDKTNNIIAPTQVQWSEFLLSPKSQEVLMKILAECLEFSSISPYQTSKGVNKEVDFFGRIKIVRDMKMNSNRNYMIVGGRQLGKSSILKKLERAYTQSSSVDCRFINLEAKKGNIVLAMAQSFGLESGATLEDVYNYIYQSDKKMLLLIDEVDQFIEPEIERDYETLKTLKNLAEEGKATFVFAGYWTLYQYVVADYLSPLYNFGELIVLEGLEKEACRELMIKPMQRIGLKHEDEKYLDEIIEACGQRANVIATICDEVLKEHEGKVIQKTELKKAMQSSSVRDKLLGWDNMDALDKVIIYLTIEKSAFEFDEVLSLLEKEGIEVEASVVKKSLDRLVIAYILKRDEGMFSYRVPLMRESVLKTNEKGRRALLNELMGKF